MAELLDPWRVPYIHQVLTRRLHHTPGELSVLDVGCGGGSMSAHLARLGYRVTGVDPDEVALEAACARPSDRHAHPEFMAAPAERLPFPAATFDVVICSEVLEHVDDLDTSLDEIYRVLRFGGVLIFSTPNRTLWSRLLLIGVAQECRLTRVMRDVEHDYERLIRPDELAYTLETRGVDVYEVNGVHVPVRSLPGILRAYPRFKLGREPLSVLARAVNLQVGGSTRLACIGWGIKYG